MEKKEFNKIIEDLTKATQSIIDNANKLIQDKNIANYDITAVNDIIGNCINLNNAIENVKWLKELKDGKANLIIEDYTGNK